MSQRGSFVTQYIYCDKCFLGFGSGDAQDGMQHVGTSVGVVGHAADLSGMPRIR